jgi:hypothetical protein
MISEREHRRELLCASELAILSPNIFWGRSWHQEEVDISCLRQPVSVATNTRGSVRDVNESLRGIEPKHSLRGQKAETVVRKKR